MIEGGGGDSLSSTTSTGGKDVAEDRPWCWRPLRSNNMDFKFDFAAHVTRCPPSTSCQQTTTRKSN